MLVIHPASEPPSQALAAHLEEENTELLMQLNEERRRVKALEQALAVAKEETEVALNFFTAAALSCVASSCFLSVQSFAKDSMSHMSTTLETVQEHTRAAIGQTQQLSAGLRQA